MPSEVNQLENILYKSKRWDGKGFPELEIELLLKYYELVLKWNNRLHLTTLTQPQVFFERHILESAFSESLILPSVNHVWDLGSGLGIPGLVIAILRPDLTVHLVEISRNKAYFLEEVVEVLPLHTVEVIESGFDAIVSIPEGSCLTVRAIERMEKMIPEIVRLGADTSQIMIFGAKSLQEKARKLLSDPQQLESFLIPESNRRYVINIFRST